MAEAGPWHISSSLAVSAYALCFGYGVFPVPADQSGASKAYGSRVVLTPGADFDIAHTLPFRAASVPFESRYPRITRASG